MSKPNDENNDDKAKPGDGIAIDPLESNDRIALAITKAEDGYTRIRLSDAENQRVIEIDLQDDDVVRVANFLDRCTP